MAMKKVDPEVIIEDILDMRYKKGMTTRSICKYVIEEYSISEVSAYAWINKAMAKLGKHFDEVNPDKLQDSIEFLQSLKEQAITNRERKLALEIQKELNKIGQLYVEKKEVKVSGEISLKDLLDFDE